MKKPLTKEAFGRVMGRALHTLEKERDEARKERDELLKERDELKAKLEEAEILHLLHDKRTLLWREAANKKA